jgi:hypothetical protein
MKLEDYSVSCMVWENDGNCPNDIMMNDSLPYKVWNKQEASNSLNKEFTEQFKHRSHHTYFMCIWNKEDKLVRTLCTSMDDERNLESLFYFLRLIEAE